MNGVQTRFKCKLDVKRCKRFVFPPSSLLPRSNALKTKAIRYFQTDRTLTRIVSPPLLDAYINKKTKAASICDAVEHLDHMIKVAGIDHVVIGTDFDGGGGLQGCKGDNDLINLTIKMIEKGYTEEDLRKIWGGNLLRVMKQVQEAPLLSSKKRR